VLFESTFSLFLLGPSLWVSLAISLLSAAGAMGIGALVAVLAFMGGRSRSWLFWGAVSLPLIWPPFLASVGWMVALGESGLSLFQRDTLDGALLAVLFSPVGVAFIQSLTFWPVTALLCLWNLQRLDQDLLDQMRLEGATSARLFLLAGRFVAPSLGQSFLLVMVLSLNDIGTPEMLQVTAFPVLLYAELNLVRNLFPMAPLLVPFIAVAVAASLVGWSLRRSFRIEQIPAQETRPIEPRISSGWSRAAVSALLLLGPGMGVGLQILSAWQDRSTIHWGLLTDCLSATVETGLGAVVAAFLLLLLLSALNPKRLFCVTFETVCFLLFALPSPFLALAGLKFASWCGGWTAWIMDSFLILSLACCIKHFWLLWAVLRIGEEQAPSEIWDQSLLDGARRGIRRCFLIHLPLLRPYWGLGLLLVWILTVGEVALCRILQPPGVQTLAARTVNFMHYGHDGMVAAGLLFLAALEILPILGLVVSTRLLGKTGR